MNPNDNIANNNLGICNIVEQDVLISQMISVFTEIAERLKLHCGPYSGTAIKTSMDKEFEEPIFTKDGINIVSSMKYASPLQDFIRKQMAYIGSRVESVAGDGTTSSMIVTAYTLVSMLRGLQEVDFSYTQREIAEAWRLLVSFIEKRYAKIRKDQQDCVVPEIIHHWAASQAYTSSHGDEELADAVGDLFSNTPKPLWKALTIERANYESDKRYTIMTEESEFSLNNVTIFPNSACNEELGTAYRAEVANLVVTTYLNVASENQKSLFERMQQSGYPVVIIAGRNPDEYTRAWIEQNLPDGSALFVAPSRDGAFNDVKGLIAIVKTSKVSVRFSSYPEEAYFLGTVDVYFKHSSLKILSGLYPSKGVLGLSPYYQENVPQSEMTPYMEFLDQLNIIIEKERQNAVNGNQDMLRSFLRLRYKMMTTKIVRFIVGGSSYDNAEGVDIARDVLRGTISSLTSGFTAGRCITLDSELAAFVQEMSDQTLTSAVDKLALMFAISLRNGITQVRKSVVSGIIRSDDVDLCMKYDDYMVDFTKLIEEGETTYKPPRDFYDTSSYLIIQPMACDLAFLKRFGEAGLKFLSAKRVIMSGYVYDNTASEEKP